MLKKPQKKTGLGVSFLDFQLVSARVLLNTATKWKRHTGRNQIRLDSLNAKVLQVFLAMTSTLRQTHGILNKKT